MDEEKELWGQKEGSRIKFWDPSGDSHTGTIVKVKKDYLAVQCENGLFYLTPGTGVIKFINIKG